MKIKLIRRCVVIGCVLCCPALHAQQVNHSDVFFTYGETKIEVADQEGRLAIPQIMPNSGFFAQANTNPGFFSERDLGGGTGSNDIVGYNVLDDLMFWADGTFATPRPDTEIRIINNPGTVDDTIIGTGTGEQRAAFDNLRNSIGQSSDAGDFHSHVDFRLEPFSGDPEETPLLGAYGMKLSLSSNNPVVQESNPFFIVFSFGMDESQFSLAIDDFNALLNPLPGLLGDFNSDGLLNDLDIDLLSQEVLTGTNQASFDLTDDALVNEADRKVWVEDLKGTFFGDVDLDGQVQFSDFLALSAGFGSEGGWAEGDVDGDGQIQFADFLSLSGNFGKPEATASLSVPEPAINSPLYCLLAILLLRPGTFQREPQA